MDHYCSNCGTVFNWQGDEDEYEDRSYISNFRWDMGTAEDYYNKGDWKNAFLNIASATREYNGLSLHDKRRIGSDFLDEEWILQTLCNLYNTPETAYVDSVKNFIIENGLLVNICMDCSRLYPTRDNYCIKCGKLLEKPYMQRNPERVREEIDDILRGKFIGDYCRILLVSKSMSLMESNGSTIVEIRVEGYDAMTFVFKKEHEYFYTLYECWFDKSMARPNRVFYDSVCRSNHDRLLQNFQFKKSVSDMEKKTGYTFLDCRGGYEDVDFDIVSGDFTFTDKFRVSVRFKIDSERIAVYDIDLNTMELSDERIYGW